MKKFFALTVTAVLLSSHMASAAVNRNDPNMTKSYARSSNTSSETCKYSSTGSFHSSPKIDVATAAPSRGVTPSKSQRAIR